MVNMFILRSLWVSFKDGKELIKIAKKKKLYIGNAPDTFLGGGNQKQESF